MKKSIFILIFLLLLLVTPLHAEILFEDNFDSHDDFSPTQQFHPSGVLAYQGETTIPDDYFYYRLAGSVCENSVGNNTININNTQHRGDSGKAFIFWSESDGSYQGVSWPSDGLLGYKLDTPQTELYVRFYIKFQSGWQWRTDSTSMAQKFFRISNYDGTSSPERFFDDGSNHPVAFFDLTRGNSNSSDIRMAAAFRYANEYIASEATPPHDNSDYYFGTGSYGGTGTDWGDEGAPGDNEWICWEFRVKMNSAVGVADGVCQFWQNGVLIGSDTDMAWSDTGDTDDPRQLWNMITLGGNNYNKYAAYTEESEQWYAIDDFVISTEYIGTSYVIDGSGGATSSAGAGSRQVGGSGSTVIGN